MGLGAQYGIAKLSSSGSWGQRQCSRVLMSDLRKMAKGDRRVKGGGEKNEGKPWGGESGREKTVKP